MRQVVLESPGKFAERDAPMPVRAHGQALIRMERIGVCGSDYHAFAGRHPVYTYPRVIGHELAGVVEEVEPNSKSLRPGDRCAIEPYFTCGHCRACTRGRNNCCENIKLLGVHLDGGLQEFLVVPIELVHKSTRLSLDQLALIETLGIGAHAVGRSALQKQDEALVVGAGPIGIAVAQFVAANGSVVHIIEKSPWRRSFAADLGFPSSETGEHRKADVVFDATGNAAAMAESLNYVATGGRLVFVGITRDPVCIDDALFHRNEVTLLASRNSFGLFPRIIRMVEDGIIDTAHWVSDRLQFSDVTSQFAALPSRPKLVKAVIEV
jgi:2-desacetyl-2-hydroxyethyl bacteriochlorophyllide A dehydrogenase